MFKNCRNHSKSIFYVRNLLKVVLPESGNMCCHCHLAVFCATKVIMGFRTVENCSKTKSLQEGAAVPYSMSQHTIM